MRRSSLVRTSALAGALAAVMVWPAATALGADQTVTVIDYDFQPAEVTINVGDTVTWQNTGDDPHTATADDEGFDSGRIDAGGTASQTFDSAGTFEYHCEFHPNMQATVVVTAADAGGGGTPAPTNPPTDTADLPGGAAAGSLSAAFGIVLLLAGLLGLLVSLRFSGLRG